MSSGTGIRPVGSMESGEGSLCRRCPLGGDEEESPGVALQARLCWSMGSASLTSCCWAHLSSNPVVVAAVGCDEAVAAAAAAAAWRYAFAELLARVAAS